MNSARRVFNRVTDDGVKVIDILRGSKAFEDSIIHLLSGDWEAEEEAYNCYKKHCKEIELQILEYWGNHISAAEAKYRSRGLVEGFYQALMAEDLL